ncbi:hypothetical protein [Streptomyces sp. NRRL F-5123]|uniref:hypothetical protein n=1 Tax=Streptomyces sp. NRRL F-5123 TaxID=1463856 RepID=UPI0004E27355|nr:hypothetical protein [Streptomyces sp. NRRL F-5123]
MPRRPPGALRAAPHARRGAARPYSQVRGLGASTQAAVRRVEARRFGPGFLKGALATYEGFLRQPGRVLYPPRADCPCCDVLDARDDVQDVLHALPPRARRELGRVVARLDAEFERRTLPDPFAAGQPASWRHRRRPWWHLRLTGP